MKEVKILDVGWSRTAAEAVNLVQVVKDLKAFGVCVQKRKGNKI